VDDLAHAGIDLRDLQDRSAEVSTAGMGGEQDLPAAREDLRPSMGELLGIRIQRRQCLRFTAGGAHLEEA
jgi:hypothetical protein